MSNSDARVNNTTLVAPGDLITADLFNALRADVNNLSGLINALDALHADVNKLAVRLAKLEDSQGNAPHEEAAKILTNKLEQLVQGGFIAVANKYPQFFSPGGVLYEPTKRAQFAQDLAQDLKTVIKSIKELNAAMLNPLIQKIRDRNMVLGFPDKGIVEFYLYIKSESRISEEAGVEAAALAGAYIDRVLAGLS